MSPPPYDRQATVANVNNGITRGDAHKEVAQVLMENIAKNFKTDGTPGIVACPKSKEDACKQASTKQVQPGKDFDDCARKHGMLPEHAQKLRDSAKQHKFTATFRETSSDCMSWIKLGFPMKPPRIHEKSLSNKTVDNNLNYPSGEAKYTDEEVKKLQSMKGLVGAYSPASPPTEMSKCKIVGLRGFDGKDIIYLKDLLPPQPENIPEPPGPPFTGDYDMHDLINNKGNRVVSESPEQKKICRAMNMAVRGKSNVERSNVVQHGSQAEYMEYMKAHPSIMMAAQLQPDLPLLAFDDNGNTYYFGKDDKQDLAAFYKCKCKKGQESPESWKLSPEQCKELTNVWNESFLIGTEHH